jgi:very-short-patch-repair endonuclease
MGSIDLATELNRFRERLLDLSNRNPLLSYRTSRLRTLEIIDELPDQVFQRLVNDGKTFRFKPQKEQSNAEPALALAVQRASVFESEAAANGIDGEPAAIDGDTTIDDGRHTDDRLQTSLTPERLESVLKSMSREAMSAIEETGVNYLFLAVGTLGWREQKDSTKEHRAPLILIPVAVDRFFDGRTGKYEFCVTWRGDELQYNLCLAKRLEKDFAIRLPAHDGEQLPEEYFREVERVIQTKPDWVVKREQLLGFFSFQKLLMYVDLEPTTWVDRGKLTEASIAGQIMAGGDGEAGTCLYAPDYDIDKSQEAGKIAIVADADSSQHSALCDIASRRNLVIEGPPGTGKSQTITNAIAAAIHEGKTVLFVAEKLAALKVVSDRLGRLGLEKFCLELHSDGGPRQVFESLKGRMNSGFDRPQRLESIRSDLERRQQSIGQYLAACSRPTGPYGEPLYEMMWRTIELRARGVRSARHATFDPNVDRSQFDENVLLLESFVEELKEVKNPRQSSWWGFWATRVNPNHCEPVEEILKELHQLSEHVRQCVASMESECGEGLLSWLQQHSPEDFSQFSQLATGADNLPKREGLGVFLSREKRNQIRATLERLNQATGLITESNSYLIGERAEAERLVPTVIDTIKNGIPAALHGTSWQSLQKIKARLMTLITAVDRVRELATALGTQQLGSVRTLGEYTQAEFLYRLLRHPATSLVSPLPSSIFLASAQKTIEQGKAETKRLQEKQEALGKAFQLERLPDAGQLQSLTIKLRPHVGRWWSFLSREYRAAKKELFGFCRSGIGKTVETWVSNLETLEDFFAAKKKFAERADLRDMLGGLFSGIETDWEKATQLLQWAATAIGRGLDHSAAVRLLSARATTSFGPRQLIDAREQLATELSQTVIAKILGIGTPIESASLAEVRTRADYLVAQTRTLSEAASVFHLSEELTLSDLARRADIVSRGGQLRDAINSEPAETLAGWLQGMDTDVAAAAAAVDWVEALAKLALPNAAADRLVERGTGDACRCLVEHFQKVREGCEKWPSIRGRLADFGDLDEDWLRLFSAESGHVAASDRLATLLATIDDLPEWSALCRVLARCEDENLASFTTLTIDGQLDVDRLPDCYRLTVFEHAVESSLWRTDALKNFSRQSLEKAREHYRELDRQLLNLTRIQVAHEASLRKAPAGNSKGRVAEFTEMGLIRNEVQKQRRHCRIRDLLLRAGQAVQALKPCMMMSPLSVAQYLAPEGIQFDLVIMDEASQIKPEDALGTLLRAKQIVVVGDPKQLPPTSFFDRTDEDVTDEEATPLDNAESVLEVAMKTFQPVRRLRWHYRSQHESLIHFSNDRFYDQDLVVFPSATTDSSRLGIRHHYVEGASFVGSCNITEARAVAAAIVEHARNSPHESLGVGTFNLKQRDCISEVLDKMCEQDSSAREAVDRLNENHDRLFIKNLESLQGDERDVIFISYTYGPDPDSGKVMNRFGPITGNYGWRRLNVLITRARKRVEVFSSMKSSEINGGPDKSFGVNAMKDYLEFAKVGRLLDRGMNTGREPDSPFEVAVSRVVTRMGLQVVPQVGVAGYFIDLGVLRPGSQGDFLLGIECDGAAYHSAKSARDRDRLREEVIRKRGWNLHRIWSTDWFLNQKHEEERLMEAIRQRLPEGTAS